MVLEFLAASLLIELTPGPNMAWLALLGASRGRLAALAAVAGVALGLSVAGTAAAFGISTLIGTTPRLFQGLRWAGSLYLLYLAWDSWRASTAPQDLRFEEPLLRYFSQGLLSNTLNPKAYLVFAAVLPQFIDPAQPLLAQLVMLTALYVGVATAVHAAIALFAGSFTRFFADPVWSRRLGRLFAVLLIAVAIWFFFATELKS
ncbi:MAG: LysE family translocator [Aestuariivirga sp.]|nr:LysE family translocator [Aestuariivirga sp.]